MKPDRPSQTLAQLLQSVPLPTVLQALAFVQARQARDHLLQGLLQDRLARLMSGPATQDHDELLTCQEVADILKLSRPRVYELVRQGRLSKREFGRQIRIPRSSLNADRHNLP